MPKDLFFKLGPFFVALALFFALLAVDEATSAFTIAAVLGLGIYWSWGEATGGLSCHPIKPLRKEHRILLVGLAIFTFLALASPIPGISLAKLWPFWLGLTTVWLISRLPRENIPSVLGWVGLPLGLFVMTGMAQWVLGLQPKGFFNDNNLFAAICNTAFFMTVGLAFYYRAQRPKTASLLLGAATSIVALAWEASSRSGWLALLVCVLASGLWIARPMNWPKWRIVAATVILFLIAAASTHEKNQLITTSNTNPNGYSSIDMRWAMLKSSWEMFQDHPTGVGLGLWRLAYPRYRTAVDVDSSGDHAHNDYVELLASGGLLGLGGLLLFPGLCLLGAWQLRKAKHLSAPEVALTAGCLTGGLALAVGAGVNFVFFQTGASLLYGITVGAGFALLQNKAPSLEGIPAKLPRQALTGGIVGLAFVLASLQSLSALSASVILHRTPGLEKHFSWVADDRVLTMLNRLYPVDHRAPLALGLRQERAATRLRSTLKENDYLLLIEDASMWYEKAGLRAPGYSPIYALHGSMLLNSFGLDNPEAVSAARTLLGKALWLDPGEVIALHALISMEAAFGNFEAADALLEKAYAVTPSAARIQLDSLRIQLRQYREKALNNKSQAAPP